MEITIKDKKFSFEPVEELKSHINNLKLWSLSDKKWERELNHYEMLLDYYEEYYNNKGLNFTIDYDSEPTVVFVENYLNLEELIDEVAYDMDI